jgi:hypothetical protein
MTGNISMATSAVMMLLLSGSSYAQSQTTYNSDLLRTDPNMSKVYCLNESKLPDGTIFFWDTAWTALNFSNMPDGIETNAPVIIFKGSTGDGRTLDDRGARVSQNDVYWVVDPKAKSKETGHTEWVVEPKWSIETMLYSWADRRGFIHSIEVLQRQLLYNDWISRYGPEGAPSIEITGILENKTLWSASKIMHYQLDAAKHKLWKANLAATEENALSGTPSALNGAGRQDENTLAPAIEALSRYDSELATIRFVAPTKPTKCDFFAPKLYYWPGIDTDETTWDLLRIRQAPNPAYHDYSQSDPNNREIEHKLQNLEKRRIGRNKYALDNILDTETYESNVQDGVTEAVDRSTLDSMKLAQLERQARKLVQEAALAVSIRSSGQE